MQCYAEIRELGSIRRLDVAHRRDGKETVRIRESCSDVWRLVRRVVGKEFALCAISHFVLSAGYLGTQIGDDF
jgi:hypothetical protein